MKQRTAPDRSCIFTAMEISGRGCRRGKLYFPRAEKLLIAGDSAGAFAVPALTREILDDFYPDCRM